MGWMEKSQKKRYGIYNTEKLVFRLQNVEEFIDWSLNKLIKYTEPEWTNGANTFTLKVVNFSYYFPLVIFEKNTY